MESQTDSKLRKNPKVAPAEKSRLRYVESQFNSTPKITSNETPADVPQSKLSAPQKSPPMKTRSRSVDS